MKKINRKNNKNKSQQIKKNSVLYNLKKNPKMKSPNQIKINLKKIYKML